MTTRDRLALIAITALAVLALAWLLLVSPERKQAGELDKQLSTANAELATAEGEAVNARAAKAHYAAAYASVVSLGKAVTPTEEVPALVYQLAQASNQKNVDFNSITSGSTQSSSSAAATPTTASAGFKQMPFTFVFEGGFNNLYHLFQSLESAAVKTSSTIKVSGRLLTFQGVKLEPVNEAGNTTRLKGTITATAYVLPAQQGLTAGATTAAPASAAGATSASTGKASSAAPVAVVPAGVGR